MFILWLFLLSTFRSTTQASLPSGSWNIERTCCSTIFWPSPSSSVQTEASTHAGWRAGKIPNSRKSPSLSSVSVFLWNSSLAFGNITNLNFHISFLPSFIFSSCVSSASSVFQTESSLRVWCMSQQWSNFSVHSHNPTQTCGYVSSISDRPFIRLKPRHESVMEVQAGQKSYRISPKLRAFPAPQVIW